MKVKELIKMLKGLDWDKEIFINIDWPYLDWQENDIYFQQIKNIEDFEIRKWYYVKSWNETFTQVTHVFDFKEIETYYIEDALKAKKYMEEEWYEKVSDEWLCYELCNRDCTAGIVETV